MSVAGFDTQTVKLADGAKALRDGVKAAVDGARARLAAQNDTEVP